MSADVLGAVVETVSGMRYSEFLAKRIFEPLGMKDTAFYVPKDKQAFLLRNFLPRKQGQRSCSINPVSSSDG